MTGWNSFHLIMIWLAVFALVITLGGMKVIGYTDVIQVIGIARWWLDHLVYSVDGRK
jgi:SSS family solute:Na+ symporter